MSTWTFVSAFVRLNGDTVPLCFLIFSSRELYAGSFLQPWSSEKKRTAPEVGPAVQFWPWPCRACQLRVPPEYQGAGALQPVSAVSRGPPRCELHSQHRGEEQEELGGGWRHLVSPTSLEVSEEHTPARQRHLPGGTKSQGRWEQRPAQVHPEVSFSASLPQWHQQNRTPKVTGRRRSRSKAGYCSKHISQAGGFQTRAEDWAKEEVEEGIVKEQTRW